MAERHGNQERVHENLEKGSGESQQLLYPQSADLETLNKRLSEEIRLRRQSEDSLRIKSRKHLEETQKRVFLSRKLVELLEKERCEIGNILHDEIGQTLIGITLQLEELKEFTEEDLPRLPDVVESIQSRLRQAINQARDVSHNLRAEVLKRFGLIPSIRNLIDEVKKRSSLEIVFYTKHVSEDSLGDGKKLTIYRVIQESLTNILKHAEAQKVFINLIARETLITLSIEDDGKGFEQDDQSAYLGKGLISLGIGIMRERVTLVDGDFEIESRPGRGTQILVEIPSDPLENDAPPTDKE